MSVLDLTEYPQNGRRLLGADATIPSPELIELYGRFGLDYVFIDLEHSGPSPWDSDTLRSFVRAAELVDIELVIRIPSGSPAQHPPRVRRVLDAGVTSIVLPRVRNMKEVDRAAQAAYFREGGDSGRRGVAASYGNCWGLDLDETWMRDFDERVNVGIMIENRWAIDHIEDISATQGISFVFIGFGDLAIDLGHPANRAHPDVRNQATRILESCRTVDIPFGFWGEVSEQIDAGSTMINLGSEVNAISQHFQDLVDKYRNAA